MKIIIAGSREFSNGALLYEYLNTALSKYDSAEIVIGSRFNFRFMMDMYIPRNKKIKAITHFNVNAEAEDIAEYGDALIAFWDGKDKEIEKLINLMKGKYVRVVYY